MKKNIYLLLILLLFPFVVYAGGKNDDVTKTKVKECLWVVKPKYDNADVYFMLKSILLKDDKNNYYIDNYGYKSSNFYKAVSSLSYFDLLKVSDNSVVNGYNMNISALTAGNFTKYYNSTNACPYLQFYLNNGSDPILTYTNNKSLNGNYNYTITEAQEEKQNSNSTNNSNKNNTNSGSSTKNDFKCSYNIKNNQIESINSLEVTFYEKNNKKYMSIIANEAGKDYEAETEVTSKSGGALSLSRKGGGFYTISIEGKDVDKIFTEGECLSENNIGFILDSYTDGMLRISTDMEEVKSYGSNGAVANEGMISDNVSEEGWGFTLNPETFSTCESLFGDPDIEGTTSWYLVRVFRVMKYVAIILLLVLTIMDFVNAVASSDNDILKKATSKAIKRFVICIVIFILPTLIEFILQLLNDNAIDVCGIGG